MTIEPRGPALVAGPILYARGADDRGSRLSALVVTAHGDIPPPLRPEAGEPVAAVSVAALFGHTLWTYAFELPARRGATYAIGDVAYRVATAMDANLRIAFVSCNGQEHGDEDEDESVRNVMWRRLAEEHRERPFVLLLHGGDQLYADEAVDAHPDVARWKDASDDEKNTTPFTDAMRDALRRYFFFRYLSLLQQPAPAALYACVPSMMIWDDHDIFDGWGSHRPAYQDSDVARGIFAVAREMFIHFQLGAASDALPSTCWDTDGASLGAAAQFPGFGVLLPDLRSERTPDRVMGPAGWKGLEAALEGLPDGERRIVVSSVPALGPRLSLVERLLDFWPGQQRYEDDLRDQWQSRAHRPEWQRLLACLDGEVTMRDAPVTLVSGEIHLATRAEMACADGGKMHQLVASGISHPKPPAAFAAALGLLSRIGDSPLSGRPIRIRPLPGRRRPYTAERNYLVLSRVAGRWSAEWELEETGRTPKLAL